MPTPFAELNQLLGDLVSRARQILGDNFRGAYLQGSFALGDADLDSDCDFLIVTETSVSPEQERSLRALHDELPTRPGHWADNIEGSYVPKDELRTLAGLGKKWLYIDRGRRVMSWSEHCNTEVVRWTLREHGVTLAGPPPETLVDEVPPDVLRARMREYVADFLPVLFTWTSFDIAWAQRYAVATLCRILYTGELGRVASKKASMVWARDHLPSKWRALIEEAIAGRALGWHPDVRPDPKLVAMTEAFAEYAKRRLSESVEVAQLIPTLHVRDVEKAAEWYRDRLGWEIEFLAPPDYAGVKISGHTMHLAQWQRPGDPPPTQVFVRLGSDVDAYAAQLAGRGVVPHQMPKDQPYGVREMNLRDLDGNYLHIGQPL